MTRFSLAFALASTIIFVAPGCAQDAPRRGEPLRALLVGGGPSADQNQVALESNLRYVRSLLGTAPRRTLFADGKTSSATVLTQKVAPKKISPYELITQGMMGMLGGAEMLRKTTLQPPPDGPTTAAGIARAFDILAAQQKKAPRSTLIYFTGHGGENPLNRDNNNFALWGEAELTVRDMARQIRKLPESKPLAVVMVQCYSGAFGNLIFEDGDPKRRVLSRDIAGFFAAPPDRMAAGCTSEIDEREYHDFTSYFFAALSGRDRVGRRVTGADYDGNGFVGMNEAFCYTLIHDRSIDVPTCTSDVFLRRLVKMPDDEIFATEYSRVLDMASPAQKAALIAISKKLKMSGEDRLQKAFHNARAAQHRGEDKKDGEIQISDGDYAAYRVLSQRGEAAYQKLVNRFPDFISKDARRRAAAERAARIWVAREEKRGTWKPLMQAAERYRKAASSSAFRSEKQESDAAYRERFMRLGKSIVLSHALRQSEDAALKARYEKLLQSEARPLALQ